MKFERVEGDISRRKRTRAYGVFEPRAVVNGLMGRPIVTSFEVVLDSDNGNKSCQYKVRKAKSCSYEGP